MTRGPKTLLRLRALLRRGKLDDDMDVEMRSHIEMRTRANLEAGMNPGEARREALRRFGWKESIKEECRDQRGIRWLENLIQDARFGARQLRKNPGFTATVVLTLALGIGANTAIFSVVQGVLLRPLPYREPGRLVTLCESNLKRGLPQLPVRAANLLEWRARNSVFESVAGEVFESFNLSGPEKPEHINAAYVTANYFSTLGVRPLLGRTFLEGEDQPGHRLAVLSYGLWQTHFGADPLVCGKTILLSGRVFTVAGVMPSGFKCFNPAGIMGRPTGDVRPLLWVPYEFTPEAIQDQSLFFVGLARLKPGVSLERARSEMDWIARRGAERFTRLKDWGIVVRALPAQVSGALRPALLALWGAAGFVLLIVCANVANLLLTRSSARGTEFAIRSALGGGRARLIGQMLVESSILAVLGGAAGLLLAWSGMGALLSLAPANYPRVDEIRLDGQALVFTMLVSGAAGLAFGAAPALQAARSNLTGPLNEGGRGASGGSGRNRARGWLIVSEVALALVLLAGAGLMARSLARLAAVRPGFEPERLLTLDFSLIDPDDNRRIREGKEIRDRMQALPGVKSAASIYGLPFGTMLNSIISVAVEGRDYSGPAERVSSGFRVVSPNYFETMNIPLLEGRAFSDRDTKEAPSVAVINQALASRLFPGENPLGRTILFSAWTTNRCDIVGVIQDVKLTGLDAPAQPEVYRPDSQEGDWMFSLVVRSSLPRRELESLARREVSVVDKDLPAFNSRTMDEAIANSGAPRRFTGILIGLFAALALVLTAAGIYGVVGYAVSQRTREIGIRLALGARRGEVLSLVIARAMKPALAGAAIGLAAACALARVMGGLLFEVGPADPLTFAGASFLLLAVALAACWLPARRAAKVDPIVALRSE